MSSMSSMSVCVQYEHMCKPILAPALPTPPSYIISVGLVTKFYYFKFQNKIDDFTLEKLLYCTL